MKLVYMTHPYGGDELNMYRASEWIQKLNRERKWEHEELFVAPWIAYAGRKELNEEQVWTLIENDIRDSDEVVHVMRGDSLSPGQLREGELAKKYGKPTRTIRREETKTP